MAGDVERDLEVARQKLREDQVEEAIYILLSQDLTDIHVQDLLHVCNQELVKRNKSNRRINSVSEDNAQENANSTRNLTENPISINTLTENYEETSHGNHQDAVDVKNYNDTSSTLNTADTEIVKNLSQDEEDTSSDVNYRKRFKMEFNKHLKLAERAMASNNITLAESSIDLAKDICKTMRLIILVEGRSDTDSTTKQQKDGKDYSEATLAAQALEEARAAATEAVAARKEAQMAMTEASKDRKVAMNDATAAVIEAQAKIAIEEALKEAKASLEDITATAKESMVTTTAAIIDAKTKIAIEEALKEAKASIEDTKAAAKEEVKVAIIEAKAITNEARKAFKEGLATVHEAKLAAKEATTAVNEIKAMANEIKATRQKITAQADEANENKKDQRECHESNKPAEPIETTNENDKHLARQCIETAQKAFDDKDYKKSQEYLLKAKEHDANANVKDMLKDVNFILSYKKEGIKKHTIMADEAIQNKNYKEAEKILVKALDIDPTADLYGKLEDVRANIEKIHSTVKYLMELAEKAKKDNNYIEALDYLMKIQDAEPSTTGIDAAIKTCRYQINRRIGQATGYLEAAELAIKNQKFKTAQDFLKKVQCLKVNIDVQEKLTYVRTQIASTSLTQNGRGNRSGRGDYAWSASNSTFDKALEVLKRQAEDFVEKARKAFSDKDFDAAEDLLQQADSLHMTEESTNLSKEIQRSRRFLHSEDTTATIDCIGKGYKSLMEGKLHTALRLYEKAQRLYVQANSKPSQRIALAIDNINQRQEQEMQEAATTSSAQHERAKVLTTAELDEAARKTESAQYVADAIAAIEAGKHEEAGRLLEKAKNLHPDEMIDEIREQAKLGAPPENREDEDREAAEENSAISLIMQECIVQARSMMTKGHYFAAESYLKLANGTHPTETGQDLIKDVQEKLNSYNWKPLQQESFKKVEARTMLDRAHTCYYDNDFDKAKINVIASEDVCDAIGKARDLLPRIFEAKFRNETRESIKGKGKSSIVKKRLDWFIFMSDCYIEAAQIAAKMKNLKLAQAYLEEAHTYHISVQTKALLADIRTANTKGVDQTFISKCIEKLLSFKLE